LQYKLIITGPVGSGKTTAIESLTDQTAVSTDVPVSDDITLQRKSTTTVAMDYGTLKVDDVAESVVHVYGTPGQERFDFMWDILSEGADGLIILLDNNRNYPFRDLKFFSEQFADFIAGSGRLIIGITRLDIREPLLPEVYEDWMEQLGLEAEIINIDPRQKQDVLNLVHKVLDLTPIDREESINTDYHFTEPVHTPKQILVSDEETTVQAVPPPLPRTKESSFELNQKAMAAINGLGGVTGVSITSEMGELIDSTIADESLNQFIAYLSGITPNLVEIAELGPINRIMLRGPEDDNLTVFVEDSRSLGVCSERAVSVPALSQKVEDMLQWL
jgi:signal recognition particle receptor subunit beta